jgi:hypothetical protein
MAITAGGLGLTSKYEVPLKAGQPFYQAPSLTSPVLTKLGADAVVNFMGYVIGNDWETVLINTAAPYPDKIARPTQVYVPPNTATPRIK